LGSGTRGSPAAHKYAGAVLTPRKSMVFIHGWIRC
jgi:hypothetical protein